MSKQWKLKGKQLVIQEVVQDLGKRGSLLRGRLYTRGIQWIFQFYVVNSYSCVTRQEGSNGSSNFWKKFQYFFMSYSD